MKTATIAIIGAIAGMLALIAGPLIVSLIGELNPPPPPPRPPPRPYVDPAQRRLDIIYSKLTYYSRSWMATPAVIVITGDSNVAALGWRELTGRSDIAGRAMNGIAAAELRHLVPHILECGPSQVVILAGTNDIALGYTPGEVVASLAPVIDAIRAHGAAVTLVSTPHANCPEIPNDAVAALNAALQPFAADHGATWLDLNATIAPDGVLLEEYDIGDGLHLTRAALELLLDRL